MAKLGKIIMKKGIYLLHIILERPINLAFGKKHFADFHSGNYYYIGSALNSLEARINRHIRQEKKMHWHIDYLLNYGKIQEIYYKETAKNEECHLAQYFTQNFNNIAHFGSTDCTCPSHLFYSKKTNLDPIINQFKLDKYKVITKP
jgi:Uri superfamily endonuclease